MGNPEYINIQVVVPLACLLILWAMKFFQGSALGRAMQIFD